MKYFTIEELCKSGRATRLKIKNVPTEEHKVNMTALINVVLDKAREILGKPITVSSGYRSWQLNEATPGSSKTSQHSKGQAADLVCYDNYKLLKIIEKYCEYDQLIREKGTKTKPAWVHVSYRSDGKNRKQKLETNDGKTYKAVKEF